jgi:threonine aldolase
MADDDFMQRFIAASRGVTRVLSGRPSVTIAEQLAALACAEVDADALPDVYGGGVVADLETRVAALLGKPAAAFFPTGTMAQQIALRIWADKAANPTVALHPLHHTEVHERKAYATLSGLRAVWPTRERRAASAEEIRSMPERFAAVTIELPLRDAGFVLPTWDELSDMCTAIHDRDAYVHFDGARLWESTTHLGQDLPIIAGLADSVYLSFYKSLGGLGGAMLVGDEEFVAIAKAWRHRYGGQVFMQWPTILSARIGLDVELPRLPDYVAHAKVVAGALATLPDATVTPNPPHTHQFQLWLPHSAKVLNEATLEMVEQDRVRFVGGWSDQPPGDLSMAEVTVEASALEWTADDVIAAGTVLLKRATTR